MALDRKVQYVTAANERRRGATIQRHAAATVAPGRPLQERLGNHAVQAFVGRLQRKPSVSAPDDPLERQADQVADQVLRMPAQDVIQRVCGKCEEEKEEPLIQRVSSAPSVADVDVSATVSATQRSGAALPADVRSFFEPRFGHDFSGVRVHTDSEAASAARGAEARAYTLGGDVVFGAHEYAPRTSEGRRLIAHELAHVVQQGASHQQVARSTGPVIQRACGKTAITNAVKGRTTNVELGDSGVTGLTVRFRVGCDEFLSAADEKALKRLASLPSRTQIIIHGFASEEGDGMFNFLLSQARAEKAKAILGSVLDPAQIERVVFHGAVPGARPDRRSVVIETKGARPVITKTLDIVSWISPLGLPGFNEAALLMAPPTIRVLLATCMALKCTANSSPPQKLTPSARSALVTSKQYRAVQSYTITFTPNVTGGASLLSLQLVGFTAPSSCPDIPPSSFQLGEVSPLNHVTSDMSGKDPKASALMKFRVSAAEESAAIAKATTLPGSLLFSKTMLRHVPWVWTQMSMRLDADTGLLKWYVAGSAFPTHTIYVDGDLVDQIPQGVCGVVVASSFRTADQPRQTMAEEAKQKNVPIGSQDETVAPGGTRSGSR